MSKQLKEAPGKGMQGSAQQNQRRAACAASRVLQHKLGIIHAYGWSSCCGEAWWGGQWDQCWAKQEAPTSPAPAGRTQPHQKWWHVSHLHCGLGTSWDWSRSPQGGLGRGLWEQGTGSGMAFAVLAMGSWVVTSPAGQDTPALGAPWTPSIPRPAAARSCPQCGLGEPSHPRGRIWSARGTAGEGLSQECQCG